MKSRLVDGTPCTKCGVVDRYLNGGCRPCDVEKSRRRGEQSKACPTCGEVNRTELGKCRPCTRARLRLRKYGLSLGAFEAKLKSQKHLCGACGTSLADLPPKEVHIDHDHATGVIRDILCHACNTAIGLLGDSPTRALKVAKYLQRHAPTLPFSRKGAE